MKDAKLCYTFCLNSIFSFFFLKMHQNLQAKSLPLGIVLQFKHFFPHCSFPNFLFWICVNFKNRKFALCLVRETIF